MKTEVITLTEYQGFQDAYDFFNRELFDDSLPQVLVTLQRHANTRGYFSPERFSGRVDTVIVHELALEDCESGSWGVSPHDEMVRRKQARQAVLQRVRRQRAVASRRLLAKYGR